jgi:hypothetical protein
LRSASAARVAVLDVHDSRCGEMAIAVAVTRTELDSTKLRRAAGRAPDAALQMRALASVLEGCLEQAPRPTRNYHINYNTNLGTKGQNLTPLV